MIKNCLARIGCLAVILVVLAAGWLLRDDIARWWQRLELTAASIPTEEVAERASRKLEQLVAGDGSRKLELSQVEI